MGVLSMLEVPALKQLGTEYGYIVHMHDACGGQSFTLEPAAEVQDARIYAAIDAFFAQRGMTASFYDAQKLSFVVL